VNDSWVGNAENGAVRVTCSVLASTAFRPDSVWVLTVFFGPGLRSV
jgi:hypothetical protein